MNSTLTVRGGTTLEGVVPISGFKHSAVVCIAASVFSSAKVVLENVPRIKDTQILGQLIRRAGGEANWTGNRLIIDCNELSSWDVDPKLTGEIHGGLYFLPAFLARFGRVRFGESGGCQIGDRAANGRRPISHIISVMEKFGAYISSNDDEIAGEYEKNKETVTIDIRDFSTSKVRLAGPMPSGATKAAILMSLNREAPTIILNPFMKLEIIQLLDFVQSMGIDTTIAPALIKIDPSSRRSKFDSSSASLRFQIAPDLIEFVTIVSLAIHLRSQLAVNLIEFDEIRKHLPAEFDLFDQIGIKFVPSDRYVRIVPPSSITGGINLNLDNNGIYSDNQPFFALMLARNASSSFITDSVWQHRYSFAQELNRIGGKYSISENTLRIDRCEFSPIPEVLNAKDLRSAAVLLIAALGTQGKFVIDGAHHLFRGYENLIGKLNSIGADIQIVGSNIE